MISPSEMGVAGRQPEHYATQVYLAAFTARCAARRLPAQPAVDQAGLHGLLTCAQAPLTWLLVTDNRAHV